MSETQSSKEKTTHVEAPNEGGNHPGMAQGEPDDQSERFKSLSINMASAPLNEEGDQPATVTATGKQSDERIEDLMSLFRDFLEAAPNKATSGSSNITPQNKTGHKRFFGLAKGLSQGTGSNNRYDYERKYPQDRFGEEASDNARVWLTYLDEAESFDRERAEGWKETVDVLLVFAGLFSGVITTFISQASQSLQKDNTQVSASLLFTIAQILLAQSNGIPTNITLNSMMNPSSPFTATTNAVLVNGLWFTSLAITLSAALFAVLAKQWLYYYLSSIPGTANQKTRARQLRFNGFESWKVAAIVELLPILLHLAVGMFLTGIIILLFPLDVHIAWTIVAISGITFTLYFVSVMLPIWYPECPYTTSMTIYIGILFFILRQIYQAISTMLNEGFQTLWRKINYKARHTVRHFVSYAKSLVGHGFMFSLKLVRAVGHGSQRLRSTVFSDKLPRFTKWREENIKKAVEHATFLDCEALNWLYETSPNRSVHRIIARCAAVHPVIHQKIFNQWHLLQTLEVSETKVVDLRYGLCFDLWRKEWKHWELLRSIPDVVVEAQLEEGEYQSYLRIADTVSPHFQVLQTLYNAINGNFSLPLAMWGRLLDESTDATVARHILGSHIPNDSSSLYRGNGLFDWKVNPTRELIRNAGLVPFNSRELGWWKFEHLVRYFELGDPNRDCSPEVQNYETCYLLFITIYRNLTSDDPMITDKEQRQGSLENVFRSFWWHHFLDPLRRLDDALRFFTGICCVDSFWCESMTDKARHAATQSLFSTEISMNTQALDNHLPFTDIHDPSLIYKWYSQDHKLRFSANTHPLFVLLLLPQNRHHLSTILLNDPDPVPHFSKCLHNLANRNYVEKKQSIYLIFRLMDLFKFVEPKNLLFTILYDPSVLVQLWKLLVCCKRETKRYFLLVKLKIDREKLDELFAAMNELAQSDDLANLPYNCQWDEELRDYVRSALAASVREFGQLIGVSHIQPEATVDKSAPENSVSDKDHDTEERAQVSEHKNYHSVVNWMKKVFESIWSKTPRQIDQETRSAD